MTEDTGDRLRAAIAEVLPGQSLLEVLNQLEQSLGSGSLEPEAMFPVRIEVTADRSSPVAEVLGIRLEDRGPTGPRAVIRVALPGLAGTMGRAGARLRDDCGGEDDSVLPLLDLFHHRMVALFHREWRHATSTAEDSDHPLHVWGRHRFRRVGGFELLTAGSEWGGSAEGLRGAMAHLLGSIPVRVRTGLGRTAELDDGRHGLGDRSASIGRGLVLGSRIAEASSTVEIVIGPALSGDLDRLLDSPSRRHELRFWISELLPEGMIAEITLRYPRPSGATSLGGSASPHNRLGRDVWLPRGGRREACVAGGRVEARSIGSDRAGDELEEAS